MRYWWFGVANLVGFCIVRGDFERIIMVVIIIYVVLLFGWLVVELRWGLFMVEQMIMFIILLMRMGICLGYGLVRKNGFLV